jgi:hypothetical protein
MAEVIEASDEEARWISARSNLAHGEPLKAKEHREVFRAYVKAGHCFHKGKQGKQRRPKSSREIAADLHGLRSHTTIVHWMREDFPSIWKAMGGPVSAGVNRASKGEPGAGRRDEVLQLLAQAEVAVKAIPDPEHRGQVLTALAKVSKALQEAGPVEPVEEEF